MTAEPTTHATTNEDAGHERRAGALSPPYLFVVLHCDSPLAGGARYDLSDVDQVTIGRGSSRAATRTREGELRKLDLRLPGSIISSKHGVLVRDAERWSIEDAQSRNGIFVNDERVTRVTLRDGDFIEVGHVILRYRAALPASRSAPVDLDTAHLTPRAPGFGTLLPQLAEQLTDLDRIARMPVTVLLLGETGTGKEVLARAVHTLSGRPGPFVAVNCGGLPASLLESQLFGHVKGSFTGATRDEIGTIRSADGGTLFLDEIGDLPLPAQAALLRVLQEREVVPVGGTRPLKVDLRVVAATHKPLEYMASRGEFRPDLLARLSGYRHELMPLRGRIEDLGMIVGDLLRRSEVPGARDVRISMSAGRRLLRHTWPLNIRELQQLLAVATALSTGSVIEAAHLPSGSLGAPPERAPEAEHSLLEPEKLRQHLIALLEKHQGKVSYVARDMGKARMQIHRWLQRLGIDPKIYRR
ncbi:sigma-54 dependent transcriptional regulator [Sorangium cellulosum]|uniref:Sigma-54 dependent transcriptional regulator n=1 Tax=Sorangium cellulosum TaxID=56 RepID=A0A2L0F2Y5_SORCE|nr:sigma 54-interacting transcriptional regulator [Sorangium cellulosum]AUX45935.1 sigma-54 dependent transcriptional regulator [Sorangium cellulosum]